jgi:hypothetical protein
VYDIASALRRRAMAERLEGLQRAGYELLEPTADRAPRPRHASEPITGAPPAAKAPVLPTDDPPPPSSEAASSEAASFEAPSSEAASSEAPSSELPSSGLPGDEPAGTAATTIAALLRSGGSSLFFDRGHPRP